MSTDPSNLVPSSNDDLVHDYICVDSNAGQGSILDRRKKKVDRRTPSFDRRDKSQSISPKDENRKPNYQRRTIEDRRRQKIESIKQNTGLKLSYTEILTRCHQNLTELIESLIASIESKEFKNLGKNIHDFSSIIRSFSHREDLIFYAYFDEISDQSHKNVNEMLMVLNLYIYKTGEEILEILSQYKNVEIDDVLQEVLVLDLVKINKILITSFKHKNEFLYSKYQQIADF